MKYNIKMFEKYGGVINIRSKAETVFDEVPSGATEIIVDFDNVEFIGRSFTQEYRRRKEKINIPVTEINMNDIVSEMIKVVFKD